MELQTSENSTNIYAALIAMQAKVENLMREKEGYGYNYTPLDAVMTAARPLLFENNLGVVQAPIGETDDGKLVVITRIIHKSGEWIESKMAVPIPKMGNANDAQRIGGALTYGRRYGLTAMLGYASEEDTDASDKGAKTSHSGMLSAKTYQTLLDLIKEREQQTETEIEHAKLVEHISAKSKLNVDRELTELTEKEGATLVKIIKGQIASHKK